MTTSSRSKLQINWQEQTKRHVPINVHFLGPATLDTRALENGLITLDINLVLTDSRQHIHYFVVPGGARTSLIR